METHHSAHDWIHTHKTHTRWTQEEHNQQPTIQHPISNDEQYKIVLVLLGHPAGVDVVDQDILQGLGQTEYVRFVTEHEKVGRRVEYIQQENKISMDTPEQVTLAQKSSSSSQQSDRQSRDL